MAISSIEETKLKTSRCIPKNSKLIFFRKNEHILEKLTNI